MSIRLPQRPQDCLYYLTIRKVNWLGDKNLRALKLQWTRIEMFLKAIPLKALLNILVTDGL